jgi:hypothetical protein
MIFSGSTRLPFRTGAGDVVVAAADVALAPDSLTFSVDAWKQLDDDRS